MIFLVDVGAANVVAPATFDHADTVLLFLNARTLYQ
jgi:hypothetical protein